MQITSKFLATKIQIDCLNKPFLSQDMLNLYDVFNKKWFDRNLEVLSGFIPMVDLIYNRFKQKYEKTSNINLGKHTIQDTKSKDVILGFSAGLDSVFQAIYLKNAGYNVHLFFARNINTYENGLAWKYAQILAEKLGLDLLAMKVTKNLEKDTHFNPYKQFWPENPMKNQLILSVMSDICLERNWKYLSLGDDFDLTIDKAVPGVNLTDAREITQTYLSCLENYISNLEFIKIPDGQDKGLRLKTILKYNLQDDYYSCVTSGRFNKTFRNHTQNKFNVQLFGNNCGKCRKCCMHNLILHYLNIKTFPKNYIAYCWEKMYTSGKKADYEFFKPELPLETRIANLFSY